MLVTKRDQVIQGETIVSRDEVTARPRLAPSLIKKIGGGGEARGHFTRFSFIPFPETSHSVAIPIVPLGPARRKRSHLIPPRSAIPRLRDEFHLAQEGVLPTAIQKATALVEPSCFASKDRSQI